MTHLDFTYICHKSQHGTCPVELYLTHVFLEKMVMGDMADYDKLVRLERLKAYQFFDNRVDKMRVWVYSWGRDCDCFESDHIQMIDATTEAFEEFENDLYDSAEGPTDCYLISPKEAARYKPHRRDRAAEQMGY